MQHAERIATLEALIRQQDEELKEQGAKIERLEESNRQLQRLQDMLTGMSWPFRLVLKLFGGMLGVGVLHWLVQGIHALSGWLNAPIAKVGH